MNNKDAYNYTLSCIDVWKSKGKFEQAKKMKHSLNKLLPSENPYHQYLRERGLEI